MNNAQGQVDKRPQDNARHNETVRRESKEILECIITLGSLLNKTPTAQALRLKINKWDLIK